jgi:hypothetical protein
MQILLMDTWAEACFSLDLSATCLILRSLENEVTDTPIVAMGMLCPRVAYL